MRNQFTILLLLVFSYSYAQFNAKMIQYPDVSKDKIVFTYGDDIWIVNKEGGMATKITSPVGRETFAKFSPDGKTIAFNANYDGNNDIYILPVTGGIPNKLTSHGMRDNVIDWYPDGKHILFSNSSESGKQRFDQFYKVGLDGGLPEKLPMAMAEWGSISPDMKKIAFTDKSRVFRNWKRYLGGMAPDIYIFDLQTYESENITNSISNDDMPMWKDDKIYYLSDAGKNKRNNIWVYDIKSKSSRQITKFKDFDINFPSIGPQDLVFEAGGKLYLLNLKTEKSNEVKIEVISDFAGLKPEYKNVSKFKHFYNPSPDGNRILIEARGEIFSVPKEYGVVKNISNSSASAERFPAWSPDGKTIAYWSDKSGEYQLILEDTKTGAEKVLTKFKNGFRYNIFWSPDSKMAVFIDQEGYFSTINMSNGDINRINKIDGNHYAMQEFTISWSPNGKFVTYSKSGNNDNNVVYVYDIESKKNTALTSGFYSDSSPFFDSQGKYIYFVTNRNFDPVYSDFEGSWVYPNATSVGVMSLEKSTPSLFYERNDTVAIKIEKTEEKKDSTDKKDEADKKDDFKIDYDGIEERIEIIPGITGNVGNLSSVEGKIIFIKSPNSGEAEGKNVLSYYDTKERKTEIIASDVNGYDLTNDGKSIMILSNGNVYMTGIGPNQKLEKPVNFDNLEMEIDPKAEWKQIFREVWRLERDFFYDKDMHGLDWVAMYGQYSQLIDQCARRYDVNFVIGQLLGEMNASHTYVGGGDTERPEYKRVGFLGINWAKEGDLYKVAHIVRPAPWETEVKSPLVQSGIDINEGDYIFSVNGKFLSDFNNPFDAFVNLADKTVELAYGSSPDISNAKTVFVKTLGDETRLRNLEWIEKNRKRVDEATSGRAGYIFVPSTGWDGQSELARQFYAQWNKDALIIDERFNNGGQIPDRFVELLNRQALSYLAPREGQLRQVPYKANFGPKVMLINGWSGSGGDAFPDYFRKANVGELIGTRTWGGLIGISGAPYLIDNGGVTVPTFRLMDPDGKWFREGHGVDPDIEVKEDPTQLAKGIDPQLEKAIEIINGKLKNIKSLHPERPKKEDRSK